MSISEKPSLDYLYIPFEPTKEELKAQFKAKILDQIPIAEIKLEYHKEVAPKNRSKFWVQSKPQTLFGRYGIPISLNF